MQYRFFSIHLWRILLLVLVVALAWLSVFRTSSAARAGNSPDSQQDAIRLENRLTQVEQRLYSIETSLRTLEQQSRSAAVAGSRGVSPDELSLLISEVQGLQRRLAEDECGLVKLDERTLPLDVRNARRKAAAASGDPCRMNVDAPLRLSGSRD